MTVRTAIASPEPEEPRGVVAIGVGALTTGTTAVALGTACQVTTTPSLAIGVGSRTVGPGAIALGLDS